MAIKSALFASKIDVRNQRSLLPRLRPSWVCHQLTYPEFHFENETEVDSPTGVQRYNSNYVSNGCLQYSRLRCHGH